MHGKIVHFNVGGSGKPGSSIPKLACGRSFQISPPPPEPETYSGDMAQVTCPECVIAVLRSDMAEYLASIARLTDERDRAREVNDALTKARDAATAEIKAVSEIRDQAFRDVDRLREERNGFEARWKNLADELARIFAALPLELRVTRSLADDRIDGAETVIATLKRILRERTEARAAVDQQAGFRTAAENRANELEGEVKRLERLRAHEEERRRDAGERNAELNNQIGTLLHDLAAKEADLAQVRKTAQEWHERIRDLDRKIAVQARVIRNGKAGERRDRYLIDTLAQALDHALNPSVVIDADASKVKP
jgi:chromosome segregation ATPase